MKRFSLLPIVFGILIPSLVIAQVPSTINYQGRLDSAGVPIKGPKNLTFSIYEAAAGGTAIWTEIQADVPFTSGVFTVRLGSVTPFPATLFTAAGERWLGVTLEGETEMTPRFLFTSSPFAIRALHADDVADNAVTSAKIPAAQVVKGLNGLTDNIVLAATGGATVNASGDTITINAGAGSTGGPITGIQSTNNTLLVTEPSGPTVTINVKNGGITGTQLADNAVSSSKIADATIATADLADNAVTSTKIPSAQVVKGLNGLKDNIELVATGGATVNASGNTITINAGAGSTGGPITGIQNTNNTLDITGANGPTVTIGVKNGGITGTYLADNAVSSAKVVDAGITTPDLADNVVTSAKIADGAIASADLADNSVTSAKIANATVVTADLADNAVTSAKIIDASIVASDLADSVVNSLKIADASVATVDLADGAVTSAKVGFPLERTYYGTNEYEMHYGLGYSWNTGGIRFNSAGLYAKYRRGSGLILGTGYALYVDGNAVITGGDLTVSSTSVNWTATKPATVKVNDGSTVRLFSEEAAEVYFTDYGTSRLVGGKAHVELDARFLETVTVDALHPMKVFVQLEGDCRGVFVANKSTTSFDVVELQQGTSDAPFTYRVVCKRRYYEDERLATPEQDKSFNERMLKEAWPEMSGNTN